MRDIIKSKALIIAYCALAILIALTIVIGWILDDHNFIYLFSVNNAVRFESALTILFLSFAIILSHSSLDVTIKRFYSNILAIFPLIIGLISLIEIVFNIRLLDEMFIVQDYFSFEHPIPSVNTIINAVLLSAAVILMNTRFKIFAYYFSFAVIILAMLVITGYRMDEPLFITLGGKTRTSPTTSVLYMGISFCILLSHPYRNFMSIIMSDTVGGYLSRRLVPVVIFLPLLISFVKWEILHWFNFYNVNIGIVLISLIISLALLVLVLYSAFHLHFLDIKRRASEEELRKLNLELEEKVNKRTNELSLINKELEAFTYSVSHDLRAPLRSIDGFSRILYDDHKNKFNDDALEYLRRVRNSSQKMGRLIDDLLRLSHISQRDLKLREFSLSTLSRNIYNDLLKFMNGHDVLFNIQANMIIRADEELIRIAMTNLIDNALKFSRGREKIIIEIGSCNKEGKKIYFIKDNGAGFDMAYNYKLFNAFQRLHSSSEFEGVGIGLAIAKRIFHKHGGDIYAESEVDNGAVFYFYL